MPLENDTKKIKLLILTPTLECGGSEKYVALLSNNINSEKFAVTVAILNNARPFYTIKNSTVNIIDLKVKHVRNSLIKIMRLTAAENPDIIFTTANHLNIYIAVFRRFFSKRIVIIARESNVVSINNTKTKFPSLYNWLCKKYYQKLDFIICQSQYMQADLLNNYNIKREKTLILNNPVETGVLSSQSSLQNVHPKRGKFITVARLSDQKGIDRLLRSIAKLSKPFNYYIIGEGEKKEAIKSLIVKLHLQNKVFLEGRKENPFSGHEDAELFLMGSYYEGFPNTLLEAGVLGIPVIAFNAPGGINEIIIDGENGLLIKDNDEAAFAFAIEKAQAANFNRGQIKAFTEKRFAVNHIVKQTEDLFVQLYNMAKHK